jgi:Holliday junction resolvasome RuvABC endonuclease subunit
MSKQVILGIDPGTRQIGISVFKGEELMFYALKTIKEETPAKTLAKLRKILETLILKYRIEHVAIEKPVFVQQERSFVKDIYEEIKEFIKQRNLGLAEHHPKMVMTRICEKGSATKQNTALVLARRYRELSKYVKPSNSRQTHYFAPLFDAIAVGFVSVRNNK